MKNTQKNRHTKKKNNPKKKPTNLIIEIFFATFNPILEKSVIVDYDINCSSNLKRFLIIIS